MRTRVSALVVAVMMGLSLSVVVPTVAGADSSVKSPERTYQQQVQVIDHHFLAAVAAAKHQLVVALRHAKTPGDRSTARARYNLAIAVATTARDQALVALGAPPRPDVSPGDVPVISPFGS